LQKYSIILENTRSNNIAGTGSNVDESLKQLLNYLTPEHFSFKFSTLTSRLSLYYKSNNLEFACIINCDLVINNFTTIDIAEKIWSNLNL
jgi:hypothetical protein